MTRQSAIHPRYILPKLAANSQLPNTHGCSTTATFQGYQKPLETSQFGKVKTRKKRRSKFDVSHFYDGSSNKPYFMNRYSSSDLSGNNNQKNVVSDPALNLRRQQIRTVFTDRQMVILEAAYQKNQKPSQIQREMVAELCGLSFERIRVWYQNRRAKEKRMMEDELSILAKKMAAEDGQNSWNSLAHINRSINSIFGGEASEETFIKQLLKQNGQDRKNYQKTVANVSEESVIKALIRTPTGLPNNCNEQTQNEMPSDKYGIESEKFLGSSVNHEDSQNISSKIANENVHGKMSKEDAIIKRIMEMDAPSTPSRKQKYKEHSTINTISEDLIPKQEKKIQIEKPDVQSNDDVKNITTETYSQQEQQQQQKQQQRQHYEKHRPQQHQNDYYQLPQQQGQQQSFPLPPYHPGDYPNLLPPMYFNNGKLTYMKRQEQQQNQQHQTNSLMAMYQQLESLGIPLTNEQFAVMSYVSQKMLLENQQNLSKDSVFSNQSLPSNSNTQTVSAPEFISGSKGLPSFDTFSHHPRLFQQQYDTTEILDSGSQKEFYSTCNNSYTAPSRFAEISSTCEIRRSVIQEEISLKQDFCK